MIKMYKIMIMIYLKGIIKDIIESIINFFCKNYYYYKYFQTNE